MFDFLKPRDKRGRRRDSHDRRNHSISPFATAADVSRDRAVGRSVADGEEEDDEHDDVRHAHANGYFSLYRGRPTNEEEIEDEDAEGEDEDDLGTPLLPIFSAAHLDKLPLYNITHAIRLLIVQRCETTLSWEQLRSPQISQFLVKPIQSEIRTNHFNRATLCALIANCLQFQKEGQLHPGNVGVSKTRALTSELLAMRLIKDFTIRELIDALSYDFDPLQGLTPANTGAANTPGWTTPSWQDRRAQARVSTIEIAIRAQAKRFLAHALVVQHLEAIWAGTIVFHSAADDLHRKPSSRDVHKARAAGGYGAINEHSPGALPADSVLSGKAHQTRTNRKPEPTPSFKRRSVTLYDPQDASLFKLSRLRVPRYRQIFSTLSFATMLGLFIAVLVDRSLTITPLEVVFWFWSAGYMLDELVGFTEQGFGLYILSFWNAFDLAILVLFFIYYALRLYGIVLADQGKHLIADAAYDVLASTAVLLFPRLFSVLDHYRYFSQLLIAFRMMAQDLIAILVLILIFCSGFFVAFTLSFSDVGTDSNDVAYSLFQILMGFTPAAWDNWAGYNMLGKAIMTVFLIICHFMIVTILITVLTNSFMAIVRNAEEEHQFVFAVNTISMVKSDALFSYIAPTNIIGWVCSPLRYFMPFRLYVRVNRTIIKATHFPVLLIVFAYERLRLSTLAYEQTDLVERQPTQKSKPLAFSMNRKEPFSPGTRLREPSVISFHKDRALDEVFRRPFRGSTVRTTAKDMQSERRNSTNVVDSWMQLADDEGGASPPLEQAQSVLDRLERGSSRPKFKRAATADRLKTSLRPREFSSATRSMVSDPDLMSFTNSRRPQRIEEEGDDIYVDATTPLQETDADGDDEENVEDSDGNHTPLPEDSATNILSGDEGPDDIKDKPLQTPTAASMMQRAKSRVPESPDIIQQASTPYQAKAHNRRAMHSRNVSNATMVFAPQTNEQSSRPSTAKHTTSSANDANHTAPKSTNGQRTPARVFRAAAILPTATGVPKSRPGMPARAKTFASNPAQQAGLSFLDIARNPARQPSFNARALDLASEIGDNRFLSNQNFDGTGGLMGGMPASFSEQMLREREMERRMKRQDEEEEKGRTNRIMLARMNTLEEGFKEVLREIRGFTSQPAVGVGGVGGVSRGGSETGGSGGTAFVVRNGLVGKAGGRKSPRKSGSKGKGKGRESPKSEGRAEIGAERGFKRPGTSFKHGEVASGTEEAVAVEREDGAG
ncbi:hypothetical protein MBLNU230_g1680t1 [Neophaeotheca triangularis]